MEQAVIVSLVRNLDVVFAFIFQLGILHESVHTLSAIGATIIICGCAAIAVRKARQKQVSFAEVPSDDKDDIENSESDIARKGLRSDFNDQEKAATSGFLSTDGADAHFLLNSRHAGIQSGATSVNSALPVGGAQPQHIDRSISTAANRPQHIDYEPSQSNSRSHQIAMDLLQAEASGQPTERVHGLALDLLASVSPKAQTPRSVYSNNASPSSRKRPQ